MADVCAYTALLPHSSQRSMIIGDIVQNMAAQRRHEKNMAHADMANMQFAVSFVLLE